MIEHSNEAVSGIGRILRRGPSWRLGGYGSLAQVNLTPTSFRSFKSPVHTATTHVQRRPNVIHGTSDFEEFHSLISFEPR